MGRHLARAVLVLAASLVALASCGADDTEAEKKKDEPGADAAAEAARPLSEKCVNETPFTGVDGAPTGFVNCAGGVIHRPEIRACVSLVPRQNGCRSPTLPDGGTLGSCSADTDCVDKPNGFCSSGSRSANCYCDYGCVSDADCGAGSLCLCSTPLGRCVKADCTSDADCGPGSLCLSASNTTCGQVFQCQRAEDLCFASPDCSPPYSACQLTDSGHRECVEPTICR